MRAAVDPSLDVLLAITGAAGDICDAGDRASYCTDWRHPFHGEALCAVLPRSAEQVAAQTDATALHAFDGVVAHGGSLSAEHFGQRRVGESKRRRSAPELAPARWLKHAFHPKGLLSPGKVLARKRTLD